MKLYEFSPPPKDDELCIWCGLKEKVEYCDYCEDCVQEVSGHEKLKLTFMIEEL